MEDSSTTPSASKVAALFVDAQGTYAKAPGVDLWTEERDARLYTGNDPAVCHPPCQRWGRFATGGPHPSAERKQVGDDGGCFAHALATVRRVGGVIEHPKDSRAWQAHGLQAPPAAGGWVPAGDGVGWTCCVWQGHYGHFAGKGTWLYAAHVKLPELTWGKPPQNLPAWMVERYGYAKARRIGVMAMVGGKDKTRIREATPDAFRDLLLAIARTAKAPAICSHGCCAPHDCAALGPLCAGATA